MNTQHRDILTTIGRHGPITSAGIAEILAKPTYGYGGTMSSEDLRDHVSKINGYLKKKGLLISEERPQAKGKPLMFWSLAESQPEEMASDVAEVAAEESSATEATVQESLTVETTTPEPVSVESKVTTKPRLSAEQLIQGYKEAGSQGNMLVFAAGVAFAERHHGIGQ